MPTGLAPFSDRPFPGVPSSVGRLASSDSSRPGGFTPGAVFAGRYRMIGLLGRGGMGEVYRADDMKIGQAVALKFIPSDLAGHPTRLDRFYSEVRLARQVSHPSVCRVYDIGDHEGQVFISMEYVDGEDLSTLLHRIGRLPGDKALEIARQLCAGIAAAHDRGVLHRDLKPANIMIDGRGRARITDFGLAATMEESGPERDVSGTPTYMAPEQLTGKGASVQSDLYALGLILYEMFTGKRAFSGASVSELVRKHTTDAPVPPSEIAGYVDPAVERVILSCLEKNPAGRPASARKMALQLPGGDPLEAALAAGETPSPAMVAAAGETGGLPRLAAWSCLGATLLLFAVYLFAPAPDRLHRLVRMEKPPEFLVEKSKDLLRSTGLAAAGGSDAWGFAADSAWLHYREAADRSRGRWAGLSTARPGVLRFWYRRSAEPLVARAVSGRVTPEDPPEQDPGMATVWLDDRGSLLSFRRVPPRGDGPGASSEPDWDALLVAAGLDPAKLRPSRSLRAPRDFADRRTAWETDYPGTSTPARVEAASYRGLPVSFDVVLPWSDPERTASPPAPLATRLADTTLFAVTLVAWLGGLVLARRNIHLKRGDRRGGLKIGIFLLVVLIAEWLIRTDHTSNLQAEWDLFRAGVGHALFWAATVWIVYLALEPSVRRRWPAVLISWSRLLQGGWRDALVGRDVLFGLLFGIAMHLLIRLEYLAPALFGFPLPAPSAAAFPNLAPLRVFLGAMFRAEYLAVVDALGILFVLLFFRVLLRNRAIGMAAATVVFSFVTLLWADPFGVYWPLALFRAGLWVFLIMRTGLLAAAAGLLVWYALLALPIRVEPSGWLTGPSLFAVAIFAGLAALAFRQALAGQPLLGKLSFDEVPSS
ncbi:MAG: serine/threonine protein kinase [Acidobacteria bacterium]|nr:serine/threonine protein kinase [Acidobacteriota bacterium]MCA1609989.1 serine/threonine protein kinase [Acidobacteriota bacterium]